MAKAERLNPYSDLQMIDNIVIESQGAYTHDEVFIMDLDFTYNITLMHYEQSQFQKRYAMIESEVNKPYTKK